MKNTLLFLLFIIPLVSFSQTRRMLNPQNGRTFSTENQSQTVTPLLQEAERQFRLFDYEKTYFALENAVAQNPDSPEALLLRAKFRKRVGMEAEAYLDYQSANRINPYAADLYGFYGNSGLLNILSIEPERAILSLSTYQKLNYYYQVIDQKYLRNQLTEDELQALKEAIEAIETNQLLRASEVLEKNIKNYPQSAIAHDLRGVVFVKEDKLEYAKMHFEKAIVLDSSSAIAHYNLGHLELLGHNYGNAKIHLDKAIQLQEDLTKAYFDRALIYKAFGDYESAIVDYNKLIDLKGSMYIKAYMNRGLTKKMAGDYHGALADLNQIIAEFPLNPELRQNRANLHLLLGLNAKAIADYTEAIKLDNTYSDAYYNRAVAHLKQYDKVSACADLEKSISLGQDKASELQLYFCNH